MLHLIFPFRTGSILLLLRSGFIQWHIVIWYMYVCVCNAHSCSLYSHTCARLGLCVPLIRVLKNMSIWANTSALLQKLPANVPQISMWLNSFERWKSHHLLLFPLPDEERQRGWERESEKVLCSSSNNQWSKLNALAAWARLLLLCETICEFYRQVQRHSSQMSAHICLALG